MGEKREEMMRQAMTHYGTICILPNKESFLDCFTFHDNTQIFWFNTEDNSTHLIYRFVCIGGRAYMDRDRC